MSVTIDNLVDSIFLLINRNTDSTKKTVNTVINLYEDQLTNTIFELDKDLAGFYIRVIRQLLLQDIDKTDSVSLKMILLKFKSDKMYKENKEIFNDLEEAFASELLSDEKINNLKKSLDILTIKENSNKLTKQCFAELNKIEDCNTLEGKLETLKKVQELSVKLNTIIEDDINDENDFFNKPNFVDFSNVDSIEKQFEIYQAKRSEGSIIKTGLAGLNRALGGGVIAGQSVFFVAGPFNYKSTMLLKFPIWAVKYNKLVSTNPVKTPLIYFVTLENEVNHNVNELFELIYPSEDPELDVSQMSIKDKSKYINSYFNKSGVKFYMEKFPSNGYSVNDFKNSIVHLERMGYEIKLCIVDYLAEMSKAGAEGARDQIMKLILAGMCDYTKDRGISMVTAHSLNTGYSKIVETTNLAKKLNIGHISEGADAMRVPDVLIFMNLEVNEVTKIKYLTLNVAKNRQFSKVKESWKYFGYPFIDAKVGIVDDINSDTPGYVGDIYNDNRFVSVVASQNSNIENTNNLF